MIDWLIDWLNRGSLILFIYLHLYFFFFQVKSQIKNIIQVPIKLLWMRWDRISYSKVAQRICRTWALQCRVFNRFSFKKILTFQNYVVVVWNRTMNDINWLPMSTLLASKALQVVDVRLGSHHHFEGRNNLKMYFLTRNPAMGPGGVYMPPPLSSSFQ